MADKRFTGLRRFAIWKIHGEQCFWCHHPIKFRQLHIDHILPESIKKDDLDRMKQQYNLAETFSVNGDSNLVPSCSDCNGDKGARLFDETPILMVRLQLAKERGIKVFPFMHDYRKAKRDAKKIVDSEPDYDMVRVEWRSDGGIDVIIHRFKPMGIGFTFNDLWPGAKTHRFYPPLPDQM
jgi:HNH endonuclease